MSEKEETHEWIKRSFVGKTKTNVFDIFEISSEHFKY